MWWGDRGTWLLHSQSLQHWPTEVLFHALSLPCFWGYTASSLLCPWWVGCLRGSPTIQVGLDLAAHSLGSFFLLRIPTVGTCQVWVLALGGRGPLLTGSDLVLSYCSPGPAILLCSGACGHLGEGHLLGCLVESRLAWETRCRFLCTDPCQAVLLSRLLLRVHAAFCQGRHTPIPILCERSFRKPTHCPQQTRQGSKVTATPLISSILLINCNSVLN